MYTPKDTAEMHSILEALRTFSSLQGMTELSELLGDAEFALAMEELQSDKPDIDQSKSHQDNPVRG